MPGLRPRGRSRASGKTARVYQLVDAYWDTIEADLAAQFGGMDAMDFFRGTPGVRRRPEHAGCTARSWRQFLNYVDRLAATEGTAVWAARLTDPAMIEQLWDEYQKDRTIFDNVKTARPSLVGYDRQTQMLTNVANLIIGHRIDGHPGLQRALDPMPTPMGAKDILEERWSAHAKTKRISAIEAAQERWQREYERTGVAPN